MKYDIKKIMIRYYSDNLEKSKVSICEILKDFGIFELELVENFTLDKLDYNENFNEIKKFGQSYFIYRIIDF